MVHKTLTFFLVLALTGCSSNDYMSTKDRFGNEGVDSSINLKFLEQSKNYPKLIDYYKEKIKINDDLESRLNLARIYVETHDYDSALFILLPIVNRQDASSEVFYLQGVSLYSIGKLSQSENSLLIASSKSKHDARVLNMLGVVQAEQGKIRLARDSFTKAREKMYDDTTIKNNLALLDMIEGNYKSAASRLMPIYISNPSKVNKRVKANLAIILAKLGSFESLKSLYGKEYSESELFEIFHNLRASEPSTRISKEGISISEQRLENKSFDDGLISSKEEHVNNSELLLKETSIHESKDYQYRATTPNLESNSSLESTPILSFVRPSAAINQVGKSKSSLSLNETVKPSEKIIRNVVFSEDDRLRKERQNFNDLTGLTRIYSLQEPPSDLLLKTNIGKSLSGKSMVVIREGIQKKDPKEPSNDLYKDLELNESVTLNSNKVKESSLNEKESEFVKLTSYSLIPDGASEIPVAQFRHRGVLLDVSFDSNGNLIDVQ